MLFWPPLTSLAREQSATTGYIRGVKMPGIRSVRQAGSPVRRGVGLPPTCSIHARSLPDRYRASSAELAGAPQGFGACGSPAGGIAMPGASCPPSLFPMLPGTGRYSRALDPPPLEYGAIRPAVAVCYARNNPERCLLEPGQTSSAPVLPIVAHQDASAPPDRRPALLL